MTSEQIINMQHLSVFWLAMSIIFSLVRSKLSKPGFEIYFIEAILWIAIFLTSIIALLISTSMRLLF